MKSYRESMDNLSFSPEQKQAMAEELLTASQTRPTRKRNPKRMVVVAAAAILVLSLGTAGATGALKPAGEVFAQLFGSSPAQQEAADRMSSAVGVSSTADGYTITVDAVIGDENTCAIVYSITAEDGTPLSIPGWVDEETYLGYFFAFSDGYGSQHFYDSDPNDGAIQFVEEITMTSGIEKQVVTKTFQDLSFGQWNESEVVAAGPWELTFPLAYENNSVSLQADQLLQLREENLYLDEVTISPLSITVKSSFDTIIDWEDDVQSDPFAEYDQMPTGRQAISVPLSITLTDGTVMDLNGNVSSSIGDEDGKTRCVRVSRFEKILPLDTIASITIGDVTIPMPKE